MRSASAKAGRFAFVNLAFDLQEWSGAFGDLGLLPPRPQPSAGEGPEVAAPEG
jgi:hypothetical protein